MESMGPESDIAGRIAGKGLKILDKILDKLEAIPPCDWSGHHVRDITDCVMAAVKVQAEQREQLEFENGEKLGADDLRKLLKEYLASLPALDFAALVKEARPS